MLFNLVNLVDHRVTFALFFIPLGFGKNEEGVAVLLERKRVEGGIQEGIKERKLAVELAHVLTFLMNRGDLYMEKYNSWNQGIIILELRLQLRSLWSPTLGTHHFAM